jgi:leucyl-tRNA synthetase
MPYRPSEIEPRWQDHWDKHGSYVAAKTPRSPKFYALDMFPYPSGKGLHVGHPAGYTASDVVCRYKRARGFNVLHPMGYDAFGLPAEQRAIEEGVAPQVSTAEAIETFRRQLKRLGLLLRLVARDLHRRPGLLQVDPVDLHAALRPGLAYQGEELRQLVPGAGDGARQRRGHRRQERARRPPRRAQAMRQWMLASPPSPSSSAQGLDTIDWPEATKTAQREWIGRSEGAFVDFAVTAHDAKVTVFTTRPDTLFGATYLVLAPEHPLVDGITTAAQREAVAAYQRAPRLRSERDRQATRRRPASTPARGRSTRERARRPGVDRGLRHRTATAPAPSWPCRATTSATGSSRRPWACPIVEVISGGDVAKAAYAGDGAMVNSGRFDGTATAGGEAVRAR